VPGLADLFRRLDELPARQADRDSFFLDAGRLLHLANLSPEDEQTARARIHELADDLSSHLITSQDLARAARICRTTAQRLRTAPWFEDLLTNWPGPIAHEVRTLANMLDGTGRKGRPTPEGALAQLRDTGEAMLKLPACILARRLIQLGGPDANEMRVLIAKVRGGEWNALARTAAPKLQKTGEAGALTGIADLFARGHKYRSALEDLSTARNRYLGHGALRPNPAETASLVAWHVARTSGDPRPIGADFTPTTLLDGLAAAVDAHPWHGLRLEALDGLLAIDLTGAASLDHWQQDPRHTHHHNRELPVRLVGPGLDLPLGPLVAARICRECGHRDVFFYDSAERSRAWKTYFLDYVRGHRSTYSTEEDPVLHAEFAAIGEAAPPPRPDDRMTSGAAMLHLDRLRIEHRYQSPPHLRQKLHAFIAGHDRGVFWLQAPAHVGKTTFAQALSGRFGLPEGPIAPAREPGDLALGGGTGVVAFFCKQEFRENRAAFLNGVAGGILGALARFSHRLQQKLD